MDPCSTQGADYDNQSGLGDRNYESNIETWSEKGVARRVPAAPWSVRGSPRTQRIGAFAASAGSLRQTIGIVKVKSAVVVLPATTVI